MTITPVRNAQGEITNFIAIKEEVTERKSLEEQLRQSRKMEAIERLAGGVAHDFNNLLTIITGYTDMPLDDPKASVAKCAEEIRTASQRAVTLTRQLLAFSRPYHLLVDAATGAGGVALTRRVVEWTVRPRGMMCVSSAPAPPVAYWQKN